jgi:hypothetical protein
MGLGSQAKPDQQAVLAEQASILEEQLNRIRQQMAGLQGDKPATR